jgi:phage terminase large subunit
MVCHRRAGKTVACIADLVMAAIFAKKQDSRFAYIDPYLNQAKDVAWTYLKRLVQDIPGVKKNESDLFVELPNGARVRLYGADNADRIRGAYLDGVILDEYADMAPRVWGEIVRPMLADRLGWAVFIGTPKGQNDFYHICKRAEEELDWYYLRLAASESGLLPPGELEEAKKDMTPEQFEQEFECSFSAAIQGAYWGKELAELERNGRVRDAIHDAALPVHTAWDLGMGDSTAIWCFQVLGSEIRVVDFYENSGQGLSHYCDWLAKQPYRYGDDYVPHDAKVRELGTGRTRVETLISMGRKPKLVPDHGLMDGINAVRMTMPKVWFDPKCSEGMEALKQYRAEYDEKARTFRDRPKHDWTSHAADAFRYLCMAWRELKAEPDNPKGRNLSVGSENQVTWKDIFDPMESASAAVRRV